MGSLDVDALEPGRIHRLNVQLIHDGLGRAIEVPVLVARGAKPGPTFGLTAALHGNELNGIPAMHRIIRMLEPRHLRGTIVAVTVVNVPGFLAHQREFSEGIDLNHIMPGQEGGRSPEVYVHRLIERIIRRFDFLMDLHTASFGRINSLYVRADMTHPMAARMAYLQRPQIIVHNPASDRTLRGTAMDLGIPAITVEIGNPQRFQHDFIRSTSRGIRAALYELGILRKRPLAPGPEPVLCERSGWLYTDHGGLLEVLPSVTDPVEQGEIIARLTNAYGDVTREYRAPEAGVVVGKSVNPVAQTGARILHLGVRAATDDQRFVWRSRLDEEASENTGGADE